MGSGSGSDVWATEVSALLVAELEPEVVPVLDGATEVVEAADVVELADVVLPADVPGAIPLLLGDAGVVVPADVSEVVGESEVTDATPEVVAAVPLAVRGL